MSDYVDVGPAASIPPGTAALTEVDGEPVAVFNCEGTYLAVADTCSHEEASLSEGELLGGCCVECPLHGAQFDLRTGAALCLPATRAVATYEVAVDDGIVKVRARGE
jgi:3-phenylpropionate/trans-cinnamate dioxygenase ferredoxin component